ncbi:MAG: class I SAM-dependent methyltransferase [Actinomycetota bacterium]
MNRASLVTRTGEVLPLSVDRWMQERPGEAHLIDRAVAPVLDVGCGPGRHVAELAARGLVTLGIDVSPAAVALAHERGAPALRRSIFDRVPASGRWATVLLIDGNIGIGGDPTLLLRRCSELLRPRGLALAELGPPGSPTSVNLEARIISDRGDSAWFRWARVSVDAVHDLAVSAGFRVDDVWTEGGRWFASLVSGTDS